MLYENKPRMGMPLTKTREKSSNTHAQIHSLIHAIQFNTCTTQQINEKRKPAPYNGTADFGDYFAPLLVY